MLIATQLGAAALLTLAMTIVHGAGVAGIAHGLGLDRRRIAGGFHLRTVVILAAVALMLLGLHLIEIVLFGLFYYAVGAIGSLEEALFVSASAYSTLGHAEYVFPVEWRLLGAIEGVVGFLMLGWSTAFFVTDMNKLLREPS